MRKPRLFINNKTLLLHLILFLHGVGNPCKKDRFKNTVHDVLDNGRVLIRVSNTITFFGPC